MGNIPPDDLVKSLMELDGKLVERTGQMTKEEVIAQLTENWNALSTEDQKQAYEKALQAIDRDDLDIDDDEIRHQANEAKRSQLFDYDFWSQTGIDELRMIAVTGVSFQLWDRDNRTLLHTAVIGASDEVIRWLIEFTGGDQVTAEDNNGLQPLHTASMTAPPGVVRALIEAGADPNAVTKGEQFTPLHCAAIGSPFPGVVKVLVDSGGDPGALDIIGRTPLHAAAARSTQPQTIRALIDNGADPNARAVDGNGCTPLHYAAIYSKSPEVVKMLIDKGAGVGISSYSDKTPCSLLRTREVHDDAYFELRYMLCGIPRT